MACSGQRPPRRPPDARSSRRRAPCHGPGGEWATASCPRGVLPPLAVLRVRHHVGQCPHQGVGRVPFGSRHLPLQAGRL